MSVLALNGWLLVLAGVGTFVFQGFDLGTRLEVLGMDENEFGIKVLITMPGIIWQVLWAPERQKALRMVLSVVFLVLALVLVALTGSRGTSISWLATLMAFGLWKSTRPWGKLGLLILAVAVICAPFMLSNVVHRFTANAGGPLGGRLTIWQASLLIVHDHPWGGVGIGNAGSVLSSYLNRIASRWRDWEEMVSHNPILQIWIETGIPGLLLYLGALLSAIWQFFRQYRRYLGTGTRSFASYFALVTCTFVGIMLWWIKGGAAAYDPSYFLLLAFLLIPSHLNIQGTDRVIESHIQEPKSDGQWSGAVVPRQNRHRDQPKQQ